MMTPAEKFGIDIEYLRRSKHSTPEQKLEWLAAALEFSQAAQRPKKNNGVFRWIKNWLS